MKNHEVVLEKRTTLAIFVLDFRTVATGFIRTHDCFMLRGLLSGSFLEEDEGGGGEEEGGAPEEGGQVFGSK